MLIFVTTVDGHLGIREMIYDKIEDTKGFGGLLHEIEVDDCYKLKALDFQPDIVLDLGGNIGTFARFARKVFPDCKVISVEPDIENHTHFLKFTSDENILVINKAVGTGKIWHYTNYVDGAHQTYLSSGLGYPESGMVGTVEEGHMVKVEIETVMPDVLINEYVKEGQKSMVKIDIEGNEHAIFTHKPSMEALKKIDYIAMEVHFYALNGAYIQEVREKTMAALHEFDETHNWYLDNVNFYARKKN